MMTEKQYKTTVAAMERLRDAKIQGFKAPESKRYTLEEMVTFIKEGLAKPSRFSSDTTVEDVLRSYLRFPGNVDEYQAKREYQRKVNVTFDTAVLRLAAGEEGSVPEDYLKDLNAIQ